MGSFGIIGKLSPYKLSVLGLDEPMWSQGLGVQRGSETYTTSDTSSAGRFGYFQLNEKVRPKIWVVSMLVDWSKIKYRAPSSLCISDKQQILF